MTANMKFNPRVHGLNLANCFHFTSFSHSLMAASGITSKKESWRCWITTNTSLQDWSSRVSVLHRPTFQSTRPRGARPRCRAFIHASFENESKSDDAVLECVGQIGFLVPFCVDHKTAPILTGGPHECRAPTTISACHAVFFRHSAWRSHATLPAVFTCFHRSCSPAVKFVLLFSGLVRININQQDSTAFSPFRNTQEQCRCLLNFVSFGVLQLTSFQNP